MPVVPVYDPFRIQPRPLGAPRIDVSSDYGGTALAQGVQSLAGSIGKITQDIRDREDQTVHADAVGKASIIENEEVYGPTGFMEKKLKDARGVGDTGPKKFLERVESEVLPGLSSPRQKEAFRQTLGSMYGRVHLTALRHEADQGAAVAKATQAATIDAKTDLVLANYSDPRARQQLMEDAVSLNKSYLEINGAPPEVVKQALAEQVSAMHIAVIGRYLGAPGQATAAMTYYKAHEDQIEGSKRAEVQARIQPLSDNQLAQDLADSALAKAQGNYGAALDVIRNATKQDASIRQRAEQLASMRDEQETRAKRDDENQAVTDAWEAYRTTGSVPPELQAKLGSNFNTFSNFQWQQSQRAKTVMHDQGILTDRENEQLKRWHDMREQADTDRTGFLERDFADDMKVLGDPSLVEKAIALKAAAREAELTGKGQKLFQLLGPERLFNQIVEPALGIPFKKQTTAQVGEEPSWTDDQRARYSEALRNYQGQLEAFQGEHGGARPTEKDMREMIQRILVPIQLRRTGFLGSLAPAKKGVYLGALKPGEAENAYFSVGQIAEREAAALTATGMDKEQAALGSAGVLNSVRNILAGETRKQPEQVTDDEIERAYFAAASGQDDRAPSGTSAKIRMVSKAMPVGLVEEEPVEIPAEDRRLIVEAYQTQAGRKPSEAEIRAKYLQRTSRR